IFLFLRLYFIYYIIRIFVIVYVLYLTSRFDDFIIINKVDHARCFYVYIFICRTILVVFVRSYNISRQLYNSPWVNAARNIRQTIFMVIQRCQKPVTLRGISFILIVSIRFCGMILCATFSYFMALRTIFGRKIDW
ncbi:Odorant receptor 387, partial [Nylanderia fulva]